MPSDVVTMFWIKCYPQLVPFPRMVELALVEACFASPATASGAASHRPEL